MVMELDWQNSFRLIKDRGHHLLQTEKWADCSFLVGTAPNQRLISGHKLFLAMASPVFERMFFGNLPDKTNPIVIPDVQPDAFKALLDYIYSDQIVISSFDKACELCYVANKYMLPHVVEQCTLYLWSDLSPANACRAYEFAKLFDEQNLMQSSMDIISANTREVLNDPSFLDIEITTLMAILDLEKLNIDSELDLFNALLKYAGERGIFTEELPIQQSQVQNSIEPVPHFVGSEQIIEQDDDEENIIEVIKMEPDISAIMHDNEDDNNGVEIENVVIEQPIEDVVDCSVASGSGNGNGGGGGVGTVEVNDITDAAVGSGPINLANANMNANNMCIEQQRPHVDEAMLRQAVKKIRFLTLSPQQFAEGPARSKILKQHEALAILIKISSPAMVDCPMPEGFCSSRCSRTQRELSYRHSVPSNGSTAFVPIDAQPNMMGSIIRTNSVHQPHPVSNLNNFNNGSDTDLTTNDNRRFYCVRTVNQQFDYRNTSVTDCGLTFQVDTNIWITGVQVPTQVLCGELMNSAGFSERYTEILYAHIQDMQGSRLAYTHCTSRVRYDSMLEISFDRPVYIYRNNIYKVFVVFNKVGWYPMYSCLPDILCNRVKFSFNVGNPSESVRDGLIRAIVFSTPLEWNN